MVNHLYQCLKLKYIEHCNISFLKLFPGYAQKGNNLIKFMNFFLLFRLPSSGWTWANPVDGSASCTSQLPTWFRISHPNRSASDKTASRTVGRYKLLGLTCKTNRNQITFKYIYNLHFGFLFYSFYWIRNEQ